MTGSPAAMARLPACSSGMSIRNSFAATAYPHCFLVDALLTPAATPSNSSETRHPRRSRRSSGSVDPFPTIDGCDDLGTTEEIQRGAGDTSKEVEDRKHALYTPVSRDAEGK